MRRSRFSSRWAAGLASDPRSIAAARIALGTLLLVDCFQRARVLGDFYTDSGVVPRTTAAALWRVVFPNSLPTWSLHALDGSYAWQATLLAIEALAALAFTVGCTRESHRSPRSSSFRHAVSATSSSVTPRTGPCSHSCCGRRTSNVGTRIERRGAPWGLSLEATLEQRAAPSSKVPGDPDPSTFGPLLGTCASRGGARGRSARSRRLFGLSDRALPLRRVRARSRARGPSRRPVRRSPARHLQAGKAR
jgi:hypothetical protein